jgi:HlyD family secretion protein
MTASADIQTKVRSNIIAVPINAVATRDKDETKAKTGSTDKAAEPKKGAGMDDAAPQSSEDDDKDVVVFLYDKTTNTVKKAVVETGIQDTRFIEITKGLSKGQVVVTEPYNVIFRILKDDMKVMVVEKSKLFEAKAK